MRWQKLKGFKGLLVLKRTSKTGSHDRAEKSWGLRKGIWGITVYKSCTTWNAHIELPSSKTQAQPFRWWPLGASVWRRELAPAIGATCFKTRLDCIDRLLASNQERKTNPGSSALCWIFFQCLWLHIVKMCMCRQFLEDWGMKFS